jgi:hypothetical protein
MTTKTATKTPAVKYADRPLAVITFENEEYALYGPGDHGRILVQTAPLSGELYDRAQAEGWRAKFLVAGEKFDGKEIVRDLPTTVAELDARIADTNRLLGRS